MDVFTYLKNRETARGRTDVNLDFALRRLASSKEDLHILKNLGMEVPPFACQYCNGSEAIAAISNEDGAIVLLDTSKKPGKRFLTTWAAHQNAIFDVSWLAYEQKLITVSGDHCAALWDVLEKKRLAVFIGHTGTVKCVDVCPTQNAVFATGSRDGSMIIWDLRVPARGRHHKPEIIIETAPPAPHSKSKPKKGRKERVVNKSLSSVTSLVFQNEHHVVSSGVTDGVIKVWDLRKTYCPSKMQPKPCYVFSHNVPKVHGFTNLTMDSSRTQLYACCTNSIIYHYDCHTYPQYVNSYYGHKSSSYYVKTSISSDDRYLLSGSGDRFAYIWDLAKPSLPFLQLPGHTEEVTAVAWSPLDLKIISCGDDEQILIWDIVGEEEERSGESTIYSSAVPYDVSQFTKAPDENALHCDEELSKSETPSMPRRCPSTSLKNVATKKTPAPKHSSPLITQWFSPVDSCTPVKRLQKRNTTPEDKTSGNELLKANSAVGFSPDSEPQKKRKSDELDNKQRNSCEVVLSNNVHSSVDSKVLSPDKIGHVVVSGILSPSKVNSVNDRVLSPSKINCMFDSPEMTDTKRVLNFADASRSEVDDPHHIATQNAIDKENVFCYEISPTGILEMRNPSESENCIQKESDSGSHKRSLSNSKHVKGVSQKSSKRNRITKKTSKRNSKEEKKKAERSITSYFSASPSVCNS